MKDREYYEAHCCATDDANTIIELLLDIRDLLLKKPKGKSREEYEKKFS